MAKKKVFSAARNTADTLRREIMGRKDGDMLGSEDELIAKLNVSRPTFRQAAKLLEQEQLLAIKRGVGGGYFARHPSSEAVVHTAAVYLQARKATLADVVAASRPVIIEAARLATIRKDAKANAQLKKFLEQEAIRIAQPFEFNEFLRSENEFGEILARACGNPLLKMVMSVVYVFLASFRSELVWGTDPDRIGGSTKMRNRIAEAILEGDPEMTTLVAVRWFDMIQNWLMEERKRHLERLKVVS
jgi:DNA-binding FadR family transcriptional regulator